jgi:hypothetical protein
MFMMMMVMIVGNFLTIHFKIVSVYFHTCFSCSVDEISGALSYNTRAFLYIALVPGIISSLQYRMELTVHVYFGHSIVRLGGFVLLE